MIIDERFIDVDFPSEEQYIFGDQGLPYFEDVESEFPCYEDIGDLIPSNEWKGMVQHIEGEDIGNEHLVTRIYNQSNEGSCVANACAQANEIVQCLQRGRDAVVHLSAISLYKRIGRSPNSGAMVSDGLKEMVARGILPLDNPENRQRFGDQVMPNIGFRTPYPNGWESTAALFKGSEWFIIRSVEGLVTAGLKRHPIVVGRSGHSICYLRPTYKGNEMLFLYVNSWLNWGTGLAGHSHGFGYDSQRLFRSSAGWAFALRTTVGQ